MTTGRTVTQSRLQSPASRRPHRILPPRTAVPPGQPRSPDKVGRPQQPPRHPDRTASSLSPPLTAHSPYILLLSARRVACEPADCAIGLLYRCVPMPQHAATSRSRRRTTCYRWLPRHVFVSVPAPFLHPGISSGPSAVRFAPDSRAGSDTKMPGHAAAGQETGSAPHSHAPQIPDLRGHGTGPAPPAASSKAASCCPATTVIGPAAPARQIPQRKPAHGPDGARPAQDRIPSLRNPPRLLVSIAQSAGR